jgi:WhiB family redox-sensing transcriptional regulator
MVATTVGELPTPLVLELAIELGVVGQEWRTRAACRGADPEVFFPARGASLEPALEYCRRCEVRAECLQYALERPENTVLGIWGGLASRARRKARRRRLSAAEVLEHLDDS